MRLRFIGKDGSMKLEYGRVYEITRLMVIDDCIYVMFRDGGCLRTCPYSSLSALCANWSDVKGVL